MAVIIKRSNGNYCVRVSDGRKNGKQVVMNATYRPPEGASKAAIEKGLKEFAGTFEALVHSGAVRAGQKKKIIEYFKLDDELELIINYIKQKGFKIINMPELINE